MLPSSWSLAWLRGWSSSLGIVLLSSLAFAWSLSLILAGVLVVIIPGVWVMVWVIVVTGIRIVTITVVRVVGSKVAGWSLVGSKEERWEKRATTFVVAHFRNALRRSSSS